MFTRASGSVVTVGMNEPSSSTTGVGSTWSPRNKMIVEIAAQRRAAAHLAGWTVPLDSSGIPDDGKNTFERSRGAAFFGN
jgi:hypothetical protein